MINVKKLSNISHLHISSLFSSISIGYGIVEEKATEMAKLKVMMNRANFILKDWYPIKSSYLVSELLNLSPVSRRGIEQSSKDHQSYS